MRKGLTVRRRRQEDILNSHGDGFREWYSG